MYEILILPIARKDMIEAVRYIKDKLSNGSAAKRLIANISKALGMLESYPYMNRVCTMIRPVSEEYRRHKLGSYILIYHIDELKKIVIIDRLIYSKRNFAENIKL